MKHRRLQELDRSDFDIVDGEPDIRGWDVRNADGKKIGEVEELILDAQQKKVRYMVVDLDENDFDLEHRKVLLPIGLAQLHKDDDDVILPGVQADQLNNLPVYDRDNLNPEVERQICTVLGRKETTASRTESSQVDEFYTHDYYNDDNLYKNRLHEAVPAGRNRTESEFERGLRLWEKRSEGGIIPNDMEGRHTGSSGERTINDEARMQMIRNRRKDYEQRRGSGHGRDSGRSHTIEDRIKREGLRDA